MKVGDVVRSVRHPKIEGIITEVSIYHGIISVRTKSDSVYSFKPEHLEVVVESR